MILAAYAATFALGIITPAVYAYAGLTAARFVMDEVDQ